MDFMPKNSRLGAFTKWLGRYFDDRLALTKFKNICLQN